MFIVIVSSWGEKCASYRNILPLLVMTCINVNKIQRYYGVGTVLLHSLAVFRFHAVYYQRWVPDTFTHYYFSVCGDVTKWFDIWDLKWIQFLKRLFCFLRTIKLFLHFSECILCWTNRVRSLSRMTRSVLPICTLQLVIHSICYSCGSSTLWHASDSKWFMRKAALY